VVDVSKVKEIHAQVTAARQVVEAVAKASPVLLAVVREFEKKGEKALKLADEGRAWEAIIEFEQAGDSAKAAAEADDGASEDARTAVLDGHLAICMLKASSEGAPA
jgi:hypothetical protein